MNCSELKQDIEKLRAKQQQLADCIEASSETGRHGGKLWHARTEAINSADALLTKYIHDFEKQNPDIVNWNTKKQEILGLTSDEGPAWITAATILSENTIAVSGYTGFLQICNKNDGIWQAGQVIRFPGQENHPVIGAVSKISEQSFIFGVSNGDIFSCNYSGTTWTTEKIGSTGHYVKHILTLPSGNIFIDAPLNIGSQDSTGKWNFQKIIYNGPEFNAMSVASTSDGNNLFIGGYNEDSKDGSIYLCQKESKKRFLPTLPFQKNNTVNQEHWRITDVIQNFPDSRIASIAVSSNGEIIAGGEHEMLFSGKKDTQNRWQFTEIPNLDTDDRYIKRIAFLDEQHFIVCSDNDAVSIYEKNQSGKWQFSTRVMESILKFGRSVDAIATFDDQQTFLVAGGNLSDNSSLYIYTPHLTLDGLKASLPQIAKKAL